MSTPSIAKLKTPVANSAPMASSFPSQEDIAARAYELFLARGCEPGRDLDDWLQAETELATSAAVNTPNK